MARGALAAALASSGASAQALDFYRIPLFLLPIYKAAAVQYGIPWQVLAAINEIETDYGSDLSVSTAGAVGWMQFMPSTWLQYGVDALNAGYADPYNPVDAVFAAARYLRAAGASTDLRGAILAYNHSEEYVDSVLLRARLISAYPKAVIATLTGLVDGRLPVSGHHVAWGPLIDAYPPSSTATANAAAVPGQTAETTVQASGTDASTPSTPASSTAAAEPAAPAPAAVAASAKSAPAQPLQVVELTSVANASVVAAQDGRVVAIGTSAHLGKYVILRDVYGDLFTYAGLGSIAPTYSIAKPAASTEASSPVVQAASTPDPAPSAPASAGSQSPLTLHVKAPAQPSASTIGGGQVSVPVNPDETPPAGMGKVRLFAHSNNNPDERATEAIAAAKKTREEAAAQRQPLRLGSVVAVGTVLGRVSTDVGANVGHLRFAIRPAGDSATIDPGPVLANWAQLQAALHPRGAKAADALLGATASDVFLQSKQQLQRAVLSDPDITLDDAGRASIAAGTVDARLLAVLAFLSRSGLKPTVGTLRSEPVETPVSAPPASGADGASMDITAINGSPVAGHQGSGTTVDLMIRTLLTLPVGFVPHEIISLMRYPGSPTTHAEPAYWNQVHIVFEPAAPASALSASLAGTAAHSARTGPTAPVPHVTTSTLTSLQWTQLMSRVAGLPAPKVVFKPSPAAVADPKRK